MKKQANEPTRPYTSVPYGGGRAVAHVDTDDLTELCDLGVPPPTWFLVQNEIKTLLPSGKPIPVARLITEAPAGMRVRHRSRDPGELRRFALHLRPFKPAKQCAKAAKAQLRELAAINREMQARTYTALATVKDIR